MTTNLLNSTAQTYQASSEDELNQYIQNANELTDPSDSITIQLNTTKLTLSAPLLPINTIGCLTISPSGDDEVTIDGGGNFNAFFVLSCNTLTLNSLKIKSCSSKGDIGSLGAGGGLLVANVSDASTADGNPYNPANSSPPTVVLNNVSFKKCSASGGDASDSAGHGEGGAGGYSYLTNNGTNEVSGADGTDGDMVTLLQNGWLDPELAIGGYFGLPGAAGKGGNGGGGRSSNTIGESRPGDSGHSGSSGGNGGYGAGAGPGGGGGGGGGGSISSWASKGGLGGKGGKGEASGDESGFGGTSGGSSEDGHEGCKGTDDGGPDGGNTGGDGGHGGHGGNSGAGAGFGGAIFVMSNASLKISGNCSIKNGVVTGGASASDDSDQSDGTAAGAGIFLQGSGTLTFDPSSSTANSTTTVSDSIMDEAGAVALKLAVDNSDLGNGADGLPVGGGQGKWDLEISSSDNSSTVVFSGSHAFSGVIKLQSGNLDLSGYQSNQANEVDLSGGNLIYQPTSSDDQSSGLELGEISFDAPAIFSLNVNSSISTESIKVSGNQTLNVNFDTTGLSKTPVTVLTTKDEIPSDLSLAATSNNEYTVTIGSDKKSILVSLLSK